MGHGDEAAGDNGHPTGFITVGALFQATEPIRLFGEPAPATASARAYLRDALPAVYREQDFAMRLVGSLEGALDPIVAILDSLPAYFDTELAPQDLVELLCAWLGIELDETQPEAQWRRVMRSAIELGRWRGTRRGVTLTLELAFPELDFRVEDGGGVTWAASEADLADRAEGGLVVYCDTPVPEVRMPTIARVIEAAKPVHVPYRLRVRKPKGARKRKPTKRQKEAAAQAEQAAPTEGLETEDAEELETAEDGVDRTTRAPKAAPKDPDSGEGDPEGGDEAGGR
ncbi:MAG TPA: phage tail protein [Solirubrobacterales bacterium]|nr:phage tail protein [Solirubrobacterales bacterium]